MRDMVEASCYLVLRGGRSRYTPTNPVTGVRPVQTASLTRMTKGRPSSLHVDEVAVRVKIVLPVAIFDPLTPDVTVTIPEGLIIRGPIEVTAEEPA